MVVVDTSVLINLERDVEGRRRFFAAFDDVAISTVTVSSCSPERIRAWLRT